MSNGDVLGIGVAALRKQVRTSRHSISFLNRPLLASKEFGESLSFSSQKLGEPLSFATKKLGESLLSAEKLRKSFSFSTEKLRKSFFILGCFSPVLFWVRASFDIIFVVLWNRTNLGNLVIYYSRKTSNR